MKTVKQLRDKHRENVWADQHGDVWYYDGNVHLWRVLGKRPSAGWDNCNDPELGPILWFPDETSGPYSRIYEGRR